MHAIILAAGVGQRLRASHSGPKCLLSPGGISLLERHLDNLARLGVANVTLCLGFEAASVVSAIPARHQQRVQFVYNPLYTLGSVVSLWCARHAMMTGRDVLIMDADVLYDPEILARLVNTSRANCFLLDRDFATGDEPVKICLHEGRMVEFRKQLPPDLSYDIIGESVGFFRFNPDAARELVALAGACVADGRRDLPHEEVLRSWALAHPEDTGVEDVSGHAWIEIDFPEDIQRAENQVLPHIS